MERITLITLALILFTSPMLSQWEQISTIGNNDLRGVKFFNQYTGIVVGQGGIWRSTNSGVNWTQVLSGVNFNGLSFPDNNIGYAVGDSGKIYKTFDGGLNWSPQISGISDNLYSVSFFNISTGHAVGQNGKILRTQTGGASWYQNVNQLSEDLNCVQMINNTSTAIAVGTIVNVERYVSTANGGTNWIYSFSSGGASLRSIYPISSSEFIAVGTNGRIRKTTNSGAVWTLINSNVSTNLNSVFFTDVNTGYIFGNTATILKSTNAGLNWTAQTPSFSNHLNGCSFINSTTAWAVGSSGIVIRMGIPVGIGLISTNVPKQFKIYQNYPNPFNPITKIMIDVDNAGVLEICVYDTKGKMVHTVISSFVKEGEYEFIFRAGNYASGIYIYKAMLNDKIESKKMILIK